MNVLRIKMVTFCTIAVISFGIMGCNEGPGEKAGEKVDQAIDSAKEKIHDATE